MEALREARNARAAAAEGGSRNAAQGLSRDPTDEELSRHYAGVVAAMKMAVTLEVMLLTPGLALQWWEKNKGNRRITASRVRRYAEALKAGRWSFTGETIIFDSNGDMRNGQHRVRAVIESGIPMPVLVVRGVPPEAFAAMDQGKPRTIGDVFGIAGKEDADDAGTAARWLYKHEVCDGLDYNGPAPQNQDLLEFAEDHLDLARSVTFIKERRRKGIHPPGATAALHYICWRRHPVQADELFNDFMTGENLTAESPAYLLNVKLTAKNDPNLSRRLYYLALCVKAFNAFVRGQHPRVLKWTPGEDFPEIA